MQKKKVARRGEIWAINDINTRGHNSVITKGNKNCDYVNHIPITHSPTTRRLKNIRLNSNPNVCDKLDSYILPKVQRSNEKYLGKKRENLSIKNPVDKAKRRNVEKRSKKR